MRAINRTYLSLCLLTGQVIFTCIIHCDNLCSKWSRSSERSTRERLGTKEGVTLRSLGGGRCHHVQEAGSVPVTESVQETQGEQASAKLGERPASSRPPAG